MSAPSRPASLRAPKPVPHRLLRACGRTLGAAIVAGALLHPAAAAAQVPEAAPAPPVSAPEALAAETRAVEDAAPAPLPAAVRPAPRLLNSGRVAEEIQRQFAGWIDWEHTDYDLDLLLRIDARGRVLEARVARTSGHYLIDRGIREAASVMRFAPPASDGSGDVWVSVPVLHRAPRQAAENTGR